MCQYTASGAYVSYNYRCGWRRGGERLVTCTKIKMNAWGGGGGPEQEVGKRPKVRGAGHGPPPAVLPSPPAPSARAARGAPGGARPRGDAALRVRPGLRFSGGIRRAAACVRGAHNVGAVYKHRRFDGEGRLRRLFTARSAALLCFPLKTPNSEARRRLAAARAARRFTCCGCSETIERFHNRCPYRERCLLWGCGGAARDNHPPASLEIMRPNKLRPVCTSCPRN